MSPWVAVKKASAWSIALDGGELRLRFDVEVLEQAFDLLDVENRVLCAVEIYAEHQLGTNDLRVLDQNLLHIIRERSRQRSSMPWQAWRLLRYKHAKQQCSGG